MTDQKHTEEPIKIGDKVWAEMTVVEVNQGKGVAYVAHSSTPSAWLLWVGIEGSWISRESPLDLRTQLDELTKQRDELREALEEMVQMAEFSTGIGFDQIGPEHDGPYPKAVRLLTKTKGAV